MLLAVWLTIKNLIFVRDILGEQKLFDKDAHGNMTMVFNATIDVRPSREIRVCGAIGHVASLKQKNPARVSDTEIGIGGTHQWRVCGMDENSSIAFYFNFVNQGGGPSGGQPSRQGFVQIRTSYYNILGQYVTRVTTLARHFCSALASADGSPVDTKLALSSGFDQGL
jgi:protein transport protein SEC23